MGTCRFRKNKYYFKIIVIVLTMLVLGSIALVCVKMGEEPQPEVTDVRMVRQPKVAHISIDDATVVFHDIYANKYDSIFENSVLEKLQYLHEKYGVKVTLYVFEDYYGFQMWDMPVDYKQEFKENADWLKIGFHSATVENPAESGETLEDFTAAYEWTVSAIWRFADGECISRVLRLHYWYATDEMVDYLVRQGVKGLLCSDSMEESYDLTEEQMNKLYGSCDGKLEEIVTYYVTDFRIENMQDVEAELEKRRNDKVIVVFTHIWDFEENYEKLEEAVAWLYENEYQFTTLETLEE